MPLLTIQNLKKAYRNKEGQWLEIVSVPSFELEAGEQVAIRGRSGIGKTTFLNLIAGIVKADEGSVVLDEVDVRSLSESRRDLHRARSLGYVFQSFNLLNGYTCLENVELGMSFGGKLDRSYAKELLDRVGLSDRVEYTPSELSIGQQQRVAVARALANKPKLVLADEPTGNLDPENACNALALIRDLCKENGAALLLVSHDPKIVDTFDRIVDLGELNEASPLVKGKGATL